MPDLKVMSPKDNKRDNSFADEAWKFYRVTRLVGEVVMDRNTTDPSKPFEVVFLSKTALLILVINLVKLISCIYSFWIYSGVRDESKSFYEIWPPRIMMAMIGVSTIWRILAVWIIAKQVTDFHNNWHQIYSICDVTPAEFYYHSQMVVGCVSIVVPCLIFVIIQVPLISAAHLYKIIPTIISVACYCAEKTNNLLIYSCLSEGFRNVGSELKRITDLPRNFNASQVHKIKRGLLFVRSQCDAACKFLTCTEGTDLVFMCTGYTISVAILMATYAGEATSPTATYSSVFTVINVLVAYPLSQTFVNSIYLEERKMLQTLVSINTSSPSMDIDTKFELKDMMDIIRSTPTQISFFGMITMNNRFFLTVTNAIVSYLMILLQLQPLITSRRNEDTP